MKWVNDRHGNGSQFFDSNGLLIATIEGYVPISQSEAAPDPGGRFTIKVGPSTLKKRDASLGEAKMRAESFYSLRIFGHMKEFETLKAERAGESVAPKKVSTEITR